MFAGLLDTPASCVEEPSQDHTMAEVLINDCKCSNTVIWMLDGVAVLEGLAN